MKIAPDCKLIAYKATAEEASAVGKAGICDICGFDAPTGYLVPAEDAYYCPGCYPGAVKAAMFRRLDEDAEDAMARYYESVIEVEEEETKGGSKW